MIVRVATDIAADRLFDYVVPQELEASVRLGCRVRVPFGGREADAYVIELVPGSADSLVRPGRGDSLVPPSDSDPAVRKTLEHPPSGLFTTPSAAFLDSAAWHKSRHLPHYDAPSAAQFITFRLNDSVPRQVLEQWRAELKMTAFDVASETTGAELRKRIEFYADKGSGCCALDKPEISCTVQEALLQFHNVRYILYAWSIMPNHVHVLMMPKEGFSVAAIVKTWKGYTARICNQMLKQSGEFWAKEYFDRFIRTPEHYRNTFSYIMENPVKAGVSREWTWDIDAWNEKCTGEVRREDDADLALNARRVGDKTVPLPREDAVLLGDKTVPLPRSEIFVATRSQEQSLLFDLPSASLKLKSLLSIDTEEHLSPKLIELARWMANYYCAPFELALRCALPAAVRNRDMRAKEQLFVTVVSKGAADIDASLPCQARALPDTAVSVCTVAASAQTEMSAPPSLTTRQKELLENIRRVGGGWLQPLLREFACTTETLRKLEEKGFIKIEPHQMRRNPLANRKVLPSKPLTLNDEQAKALEMVVEKIDRTDRTAQSDPTDRKLRPLLLYGVTGSGKTEVYLQAISRTLERGKSAIVLVPEIALTPQTVQRFAARFGERIAVLHSALSEGERFDEWHRIRTGEAVVVVGPRSALFAPVRNLGIIIVDEEHEPSYKQDETPRYHARDVAVMRAHFEGAVVVLGTATPSMETWLNVQKGKYAVAHLTCRVANRPMPLVRVVDMRLSKAKLFSTELLDAIHLRLERGEQTILFLNRRGHSNSLVCPTCGYAPSCDQCSVSYTYHRSDNCLRCHVCGGWEHVPDKCPSCKDPAFRYAGFGTQKVEDALKKIFSRARVLRMDADVTTRKSSHDEILGLFKSGHADILIGTQMIAKGLDFPNVTLVGVLSADMSLHIPDFRAGERTYQLLAQVSGRAGRDVLPGEVFVQTFTPDHPAILAAASKEEAFCLFAEKELAEREAGEYPPYTHLVCLGFKGASEERVKFVATTMARELKAKEKGDSTSSRTLELSNFITSDAYPAPLAKAKGLFRYQIILRASTTRLMTQPLREVIEKVVIPKEVTFSIDVDAMNMG